MPEAGRRLSRAEAVALASLVLVALAVRLWGIGFGLPFTYHPDEHQYVDVGVQVLSGELNPGRFNNPSLLKYALAAAYGAALLGARAFGSDVTAADWLGALETDPTAPYLLGRALVALSGAATVGAVWLLGSRAYGRRTGWVAAVLLAAAYLHARQSHFAVSDVPATLAVTLALVWSCLVLEKARTRDYVVAGVFVGLAAATKYSAGLVAVPLVVAHLAAEGAAPRDAPRRLVDRRLLLAGGVAVAAFLAAVPFAVLDLSAFRADLALLAERGRVGFKGVELSPLPGWLFYLDSLRWGLGWPLLAASVAGLGAALVRRRRVDLVLASLPIALYAYLAPQLLLFARFALPALPPLFVLAAALVDAGAARLAPEPRRGRVVTAALVAGLVAVPLARTLRFDLLLGRADTRTQAHRWIVSHLPAGAKVVAHSNGPELAGAGRDAPAASRSYDLVEVGTTGLEERSPAEWAADGVQYVVTSSFSTDRRMLDPAEDARRRAYFADLDANLERLAEFRPTADRARSDFLYDEIYGPAVDLWALERPGPVVTVYRLPGD